MSESVSYLLDIYIFTNSNPEKYTMCQTPYFIIFREPHHKSV